MKRTGRNDPCPCGSGRKYKKCCLPTQQTQQPQVTDINWRRMRTVEGKSVEPMLRHAEQHYGSGFMQEAWADFAGQFEWSPNPDETAEVDAMFIPWLLYNWIPENEGVPPDEHLPQIAIALHYLTENKNKLDRYTARFIEAACTEPYSFFSVTAVSFGRSMTLKDLFIGREVTVIEKQASETLQPGDMVFTRIVSLDDSTIMLGCAPTLIPSRYAHNLINIREAWKADGMLSDKYSLRELDRLMRHLYGEIREQVFHPQPPQLTNTDGDPLEMVTLHYSLLCSPMEAVEALLTLCTNGGGSRADILADAEYDKRGELKAVEFPWLKDGNARSKNWGNIARGQIVINGAKLEIEVNSQERADTIKRKISRRLGKRVRYRTAVIESPASMLQGEDLPPAPDNEELMANPEVMSVIAQMGQQHWQEWLDVPLPALDGESPRQATSTSLGREKLEFLLQDLAASASADNSPFAPDVEALRRELGLG